MEWVDATGVLVADGVTDDKAALQTLINANTGKQINLPVGKTVAIGSMVTLPANTVIHGRNSTIKATFSGTDLFDFQSKDRLVLAYLTIDGNQTIERMLHYTNSTTVTVTHCTIKNFKRAPIRSASGSNWLVFTYNTVQDIGGSAEVVSGSSSSYTKNAVIARNTFANVGNHDGAGDWVVYTSGPPSEAANKPGDFATRIFNNTSDNTCSGGIKVQWASPITLPLKIHDNTIAVEAGGVNTMVVDGSLAAEIYNNTHNPTGGAVMAFSVNGVQTIANVHDETFNCNSQATAGTYYGIHVANSAASEITIDQVALTVTKLGVGDDKWSALLAVEECAALTVTNSTLDATGLSAVWLFYHLPGGGSVSGVAINSNTVTGCQLGFHSDGPVTGLTLQNNVLTGCNYFLDLRSPGVGITSVDIDGNSALAFQWGYLDTVSGTITNNTGDSVLLPADGDDPANWLVYLNNASLTLSGNVGGSA